MLIIQSLFSNIDRQENKTDWEFILDAKSVKAQVKHPFDPYWLRPP